MSLFLTVLYIAVYSHSSSFIELFLFAAQVNDSTPKAKIILPNIKDNMKVAKLNFIISGHKSAESEAQDFDLELDKT
jgi:hypothetical protein